MIAGVTDPRRPRGGERIREAIVAAPFRLACGSEIAVTLSAGVAVGAGSMRRPGRRGRPRAVHREAPRPRPGAPVRRPRPRRPRARGLRRDPARRRRWPSPSRRARAPGSALAARRRPAGAVAAHLGLPDAMVERCRLGGWLHDVGKLDHPGRRRREAGPVDAAEQEIDAGPRDDRRPARADDAGLAEAGTSASGTTTSGSTARAIPTAWRAPPSRSRRGSWRRPTSSPPRTARGLDRAEALAELERAAGIELDPQVVGALVAVLHDESRAIAARFGTAA